MKHRSLWLLLVTLSGTAAGAPATFRISGEVAAGPRSHVVYVALWDAQGFLARPVQTARIEPAAPPVFHFDVAPGRWALSAYEDVNGNGRLDMGFFGPREPSGFWRPFHAWRKPRFDDVAFAAGGAVAGIVIALK